MQFSVLIKDKHPEITWVFKVIYKKIMYTTWISQFYIIHVPVLLTAYWYGMCDSRWPPMF